MNAYLEETVAKYLHPSDDYISLTEIARKFDAKNPSYLIQSWLRNRNTVKFLATWERNNNPDFNEVAFEKLVVEAKTPQFTWHQRNGSTWRMQLASPQSKAREVEQWHTHLLRVILKCGTMQSSGTKC